MKNNPNKNFSQGMKEFELAWKDFFDKRPAPKNEKEEKNEMMEFLNWYNNIRKQSDTGKTPSEMYEEIYGGESQSSRKINYEWDEDYWEPDELLAQSDQYIIEGDYENALSLTKKVLKLIPDDEDALIQKANVLTAMQKYNEAEKIINKVEKIYGQTSYFLFCSSNLYFHRGNFAKAVELLRKAIEKDSDNFDFAIGLANYLYLKNDEDYKNYFEKSEKIDKKRADNFKKKFWLEREELMNGKYLIVVLDCIIELLKNKETNRALENINFLLANKQYITPEITEIILGLEIECYFLEKKIKIAKEKIENLILINNKNPHAYFYKAQILIHDSKLPEALLSINKCLEIAEEKIPNPDFYLAKAEILKKMNNNEYMFFENKGKELREKLNSMKIKDIMKKFQIKT